MLTHKPWTVMPRRPSWQKYKPKCTKDKKSGCTIFRNSKK